MILKLSLLNSAVPVWLRSIKTRLRSARQFNKEDWQIIAQYWIQLLMADLALSTIKLNRILKYLSKQNSAIAAKRPARPEFERKRSLLETVARHHLYPMTCLRQAIVLFWNLKRASIPCSLKIGVLSESGQIKAHAWVEVDEMLDRCLQYKEVLSVVHPSPRAIA